MTLILLVLFALLCQARFSVTEDAFLLSKLGDDIVLRANLTKASSEVTEWDVLLGPSTFVLRVDSMVPLSENGFWIVGFKYRSAQEIYDMVDHLGQLKKLEGEYQDGYCSNLPYYYNYTIENIINSHSLYAEDSDGNAASIFDWRFKPSFNPFRDENGYSYNKTSLKSMTGSLNKLTGCFNTSDMYESGTFFFKKPLYHSYIRVKESCLGAFSFHVDQCVEIFQRSTLLVWKLATHVLISETVSSLAAASSVVEEGKVAAEATDGQTIQFLSDKGKVLIRTDVNLNFNFPEKQENEFVFYLPESFNIAGFENPGEEEYWNITKFPSVDFTPILVYLGLVNETASGDDVDHFVQPGGDDTTPGRYDTTPAVPRVTSDITEAPNNTLIPDLTRAYSTVSTAVTETNWENKTTEDRTYHPLIDDQFYKEYLADREFPMSILPESNDTVHFSFVITSETDKSRELFNVSQKFVSVSCTNSSNSSMVCRFGRVLTNISTAIQVEVESETQFYTVEAKLDWRITQLSVSSLSANDSISPIIPNYRPLYATESLLAQFAIAPRYLLLKYKVVLYFITLEAPTTAHSSLIYANPGYVDEMRESWPDILFPDTYTDKRTDSFGSFSCTSDGFCRLVLKSRVFSQSPSGDYNLTLALRIEQHDHARARRDVRDSQLTDVSDPTKRVTFTFSYVDRAVFFSSSTCSQFGRLFWISIWTFFIVNLF